MPSCEKDTSAAYADPAAKNNTTSGDMEKVRWLLQQTKLINQKIDPNLRFRSVKNKDGTYALSISNISESTLPQLTFVTSTDINSSLGFITNATVYLSDDPMNIPTNIPGFTQNMNLVFLQANTKSYQEGNKFFTPFIYPFLYPNTENHISVSEYVDIVTGLVPDVIHTDGKKKLFKIVFNSAITEQNQVRNGGATPDGTCWLQSTYGATFCF